MHAVRRFEQETNAMHTAFKPKFYLCKIVHTETIHISQIKFFLYVIEQ